LWCKELSLVQQNAPAFWTAERSGAGPKARESPKGD